MGNLKVAKKMLAHGKIKNHVKGDQGIYFSGTGRGHRHSRRLGRYHDSLGQQLPGQLKAQAYNVERQRIQDVVNLYWLSPDSTRFLRKRQYPIHGALKIQGEIVQPDENESADTVLVAGNAFGGTLGGKPQWIDNQNGIRDEPDEDVLNDEDDLTRPGWQVASLVLHGVDVLVDSRDYFINFEILVAEDYLETVPSSASPDNVPPGSSESLAGPYSWFVNKRGIVQSTLFSFPTPENIGFQDVFPSE